MSFLLCLHTADPFQGCRNPLKEPLEEAAFGGEPVEGGGALGLGIGSGQPLGRGQPLPRDRPPEGGGDVCVQGCGVRAAHVQLPLDATLRPDAAHGQATAGSGRHSWVVAEAVFCRNSGAHSISTVLLLTQCIAEPCRILLAVPSSPADQDKGRDSSNLGCVPCEQ